MGLMSEWQIITSNLLKQVIVIFYHKITKKNGQQKVKRCDYNVDKGYLLSQKVWLNVSEKLPLRQLSKQ